MSEEIKEILDDIKRHLDYVEATKQSSIRDNEMKAMYDYITNLQEENIKLKELCDKYEEEHNTTFIEWQKDIKANKKAIEYIEKYVSVYDMEGDLRERLLNKLKGDNK